MEGESTEAHSGYGRRRRSARHRALRWLERWLPLLLICVAVALSAGVVRVMEVSTRVPVTPLLADELIARPARTNSSRALNVVDVVPELTPASSVSSENAIDAVLRASVLDGEAGQEVDEEPDAPLLDEVRYPGDSSPDSVGEYPDAASLVPEPGTFLLVATGLAWSTRAARAASSRVATSGVYGPVISNNSMSNASAAPGGITGG